MRDQLDVLLVESLLLGASEALEDLADDLIDLRHGWVTHGAAAEAVEWLDGLIAKVGWWAGRLATGTHDHVSRRG
jgi:hypothetical protein